MKISLSFILLSLCTAVLAATSATNATDETTTVTDQSSHITNTVAPTTDGSTSTVTSSDTSTTNEPTTVPTVTPSTIPSSTDVPVTSPSPAPTTTKAPEPEKCEWNVTCIRAELKAQFVIPVEDKKYTINVGCNATELGDCSSNDTQTLYLVESNYYNLTLVFEKQENSVFIRNITFKYTLPEVQGVVSNNSGNILKVKAGNSYRCKSDFDINLENVTMEISYIQVQAFFDKDNEQFGAVEECEADDKVSDIVPIAVGVALAALIIIVLIAYLVGRRRSRQKGYQSV